MSERRIAVDGETANVVGINMVEVGVFDRLDLLPTDAAHRTLAES